MESKLMHSSNAIVTTGSIGENASDRKQCESS